MSPVWIVVIIVFVIIIAYGIYRSVLAHRLQIATGKEELIGKTAVVRAPLDPEGIVFVTVDGERWVALSESGRIESGEEVVIKKVDGMRLIVSKKEANK